MREVDRRRFKMLTRVSLFGAERRRRFPNDTAGARLFGEIDAVIHTIGEAAASEQQGRNSAMGATRVKAAGRANLRRQLDAIRATARALASRRADLAVAPFPRRPRDHELLAAAKTIAVAVAPNADAFIAHYMPKTFLADLHDAIAAFEKTLTGRIAARTQHMSARTDIRAALSSGAAAALQLDAAVANAFRDDPATLRVWWVARRVGSRIGRPPTGRKRGPEAAKRSRRW